MPHTIFTAPFFPLLAPFASRIDKVGLRPTFESILIVCSLGNTCYMNSTVQVLRAIPELNTALDAYSPSPQAGQNGMLTAEMRRLYQNMGQTTEKIIPAMFLQRLRVVNPQFAEQRPGQGYAQQGWVAYIGHPLISLTYAGRRGGVLGISDHLSSRVFASGSHWDRCTTSRSS
jgi:hypothetical protein